MQKIVQKLTLILMLGFGIGMAHAQSDALDKMNELYGEQLQQVMGQIPVYAQPIDDETPLHRPENLYYLVPGNVGVIAMGCANLRDKTAQFQAMDQKDEHYILLMKEDGECLAFADEDNPSESRVQEWIRGEVTDLFGKKWRLKIETPDVDKTMPKPNMAQ